MTNSIFEMRWVEFGPNRQLEYRTRNLRINVPSGTVIGLGGWSDWQIVPKISGEEAAYGDLCISGGIPVVGD